MGRRRKKRSAEQCDGVLVLNKPSGPTSAACLNDIKHQLKQYKIGHAGTLDPLAQGVLLVMLGHGTKLAPYLTDRVKTYTGTFRLGMTTDTLDIQGEVTSESDVTVSDEDVKREILYWKELTEQEVPAYSAAKHKGKPLYALAREGKETPVKIKPIVILMWKCWTCECRKRRSGSVVPPVPTYVPWSTAWGHEWGAARS